MLQNLLAERLKLAYHLEKKLARVYDLAIAKNRAKLQESPPESAEKPQQANSRHGTNTAFQIRRPISRPIDAAQCQVTRCLARGVTTAQMAKMLATRLQGPVTHSTGLAGKYDFTLYFSAASVGLSSSPALAGPRRWAPPERSVRKPPKESASPRFS